MHGGVTTREGSRAVWNWSVQDRRNFYYPGNDGGKRWWRGTFNYFSNLKKCPNENKIKTLQYLPNWSLTNKWPIKWNTKTMRKLVTRRARYFSVCLYYNIPWEQAYTIFQDKKRFHWIVTICIQICNCSRPCDHSEGKTKIWLLIKKKKNMERNEEKSFAREKKFIWRYFTYLAI